MIIHISYNTVTLLGAGVAPWLRVPGGKVPLKLLDFESLKPKKDQFMYNDFPEYK